MQRALAALALAVASPLPLLLAGPAHAQVVVRSGETLSELAERHGVSLSGLMQANGISNPDHVMVGQTLVIPGSDRSAPRASGSRSGRVTVQPGDTLSEIAVREGVGLTALMQANGLGNADHVMVGEQLLIPGGGRSSAAAAAGASRKSTPTAPYTVKGGETLSDIAAHFGTSTERLIQINGIGDPDHVMAGSRLQIPVRPGSRPAAKSSSSAKVSATAKEHVVSPGESLGDIASRYGTSVARLSALNGLDNPDLVLAGTRLKLVGNPPAKTAAAPAAKPAVQPVAKPMAQPEPSPTPDQTAAAQEPASTTSPDSTSSEASTEEPAAAPAAQQPLIQASGALAPRANTATDGLAPRASVAPAATALQATTPAAMPVAATAATATAATATAAAASQADAAASSARATTSSLTTSSRLALATAGVGSVSQVTAAPAKAASATATSSTIAARAVSSTTSKPAGTGSTSASPASDETHDWRSYGPLQVDWANWKPMGGSYVAPTLNSEGDPLYLAINCGARKVNATSQSGQWNTWEDPTDDHEQKLVTDLCKTKGG
ncbi:LysM peptidoglycan-binding domain-containing protein [Cyanobium sp. LEGE 06143]|uniref:LysM peptidoglycan-binding domain-containing protein n=1 Tax=Cyanobium sp. LEGE 06143 TaxID=945727 RepID=UPI00188301C5|nr:LysM peptidoglycan-binding domain-containing protein [Cyanobium sp. LEGE 06143]MBE9171769.1 LysM peptidoglycan-binding domain-containing protein [Cyanobium sp. LEGE 06143]